MVTKNIQLDKKKSSITKYLVNQVKSCLKIASENNCFDSLNREIEFSMNIHLLLGIILEGVINELGDRTIDSWTWKELEKSPTPLKWKIISGVKNGFDPSGHPLGTIITLQVLRNSIAHPKTKNVEKNLILEYRGKIKIVHGTSITIPAATIFGSVDLHVGAAKLYQQHNLPEAKKNTILVFKAILEIRDLLEIKDLYEFLNDDLIEIEGLEISKREELEF